MDSAACGWSRFAVERNVSRLIERKKIRDRLQKCHLVRTETTLDLRTIEECLRAANMTPDLWKVEDDTKYGTLLPQHPTPGA